MPNLKPLKNPLRMKRTYPKRIQDEDEENEKRGCYFIMDGIWTSWQLMWSTHRENDFFRPILIRRDKCEWLKFESSISMEDKKSVRGNIESSHLLFSHIKYSKSQMSYSAI